MNALDVANKNEIGMPRVKNYILNTIFHSQKNNAKLKS